MPIPLADIPRPVGVAFDMPETGILRNATSGTLGSHVPVEPPFCILQAFETASGKDVKYKLVPRREGDSVAVWAATETAEKELGWKTKLNVDDMCCDQWKWASQYPKGYEV